MAVAVHSSLNWLEFREYIRINSKKIHPKANDTIYRIGMIELINPVVMGKDEFVDFCPHLIKME